MLNAKPTKMPALDFPLFSAAVLVSNTSKPAHFSNDKHTTCQIILRLHGSTEPKVDGKGGEAREKEEWNKTYFTGLYLSRALGSIMS